VKAVHAFLAAVWLLFGLTATAHAMPQNHAPCHEMAMHHDKKAPAPLPDIGMMPCCSQPAALPASDFTLPALTTTRLQHEAQPAAVLSGIVTPQDPRPPQND